MGEAKVEIQFDKVVRETDASWTVTVDSRRVVLPKSNCDVDAGDGTAMVPEWLAIEEELV